MSYADKFLSAVTFTRKLGFTVGDLPRWESELVSEKNGLAVMTQLQRAGIASLVPSAGQCLRWNHALQPLVEEGLGCPVVLTIGCVSIGRRPIYDAAHDDFARWSKNGITVQDFRTRAGFNFHAWYTLPTMEILDMTLWSTLAVVWDKPEIAGSVVGGWPDLIAPNPSYIPIVAGSDYVEHVHAISQVPLIASDRTFSSLSRFPMMLMSRWKS